ncbi:DUF1203 domain-containing protein [Nostoc sp. NIES-2111]
MAHRIHEKATSMSIRILGLDPALFRHLYGRSADDLARLGVRRCIVDAKPGFPDRVTLRDVEPGRTALLLNFMHQPANSPFRSSHAIYVEEGAEQRYDVIGEVPEAILARTISLRAFDAAGNMVDGDLTEGAAITPLAERLLSHPSVSYLHAHYARFGCFAARIERA